MNTATHRWTLSSMRVCDFLGYQGERRLAFGPSLQVIEAPNHTGKTSLAMAMLWGLTGNVPKLVRVDGRSFQFTNRHAGTNAEAEVEVILCSGDQTMSVHRRYRGGKRNGMDGDLTVAVNGSECQDDDAQILIEKLLDIKPESLEGCGVVLQDHRLKLITGREQEIGDVINDMLGLVYLSELVPALEDAAGEAKALRKEVDAYLTGSNPLKRFEEKEAELTAGWQAKEREATASGYEVADLQDPRSLLNRVLDELAQRLDTDAPRDLEEPKTVVERLRRTLGHVRQVSPEFNEVAEIEGQQQRWSNLTRRMERLLQQWREHDRTLASAATKGTLDQDSLSRQVARAEDDLNDYQARLSEIAEEQGFLEAAYSHLLAHSEFESCPLCGKPNNRSSLIDEVKVRIDSRLAAEIASIRAKEDEAKRKKAAASERLKVVRDLFTEHQKFVAQADGIRTDLTELQSISPFELDEAKLFSNQDNRHRFINQITETAEALHDQIAELESKGKAIKESLAQREQEKFQPLQDQIDRTRDVLIPLVDCVDALEAHSSTRDQAEERASVLTGLAEEVKVYAQRLSTIGRVVSEQEQGRADAAVRERLPFISEFFSKVAANPDYTGLKLSTKERIIRGRVAYRLTATSSKLGTLEDAVGHVLSEGDLSAAGVALLLGLASGSDHKLGFLLLDDPAQGMDPDMQSRLARELAALPEKPQIVIFTHHPEFAKALEEHGATRSSLGRWEGGRNHDG